MPYVETEVTTAALEMDSLRSRRYHRLFQISHQALFLGEI